MDTEPDDLDIYAEFASVLPDDVAINGTRIEGSIQCARSIVPDGPEEGTGQIAAKLQHGQVLGNESLSHLMHGNIPDFVPLPFDTKVQHALACLQITDTQLAELFPPDAVVEQGGQDCPVTYTLEGVAWRRIEEPSRLSIAESRRAAFIGSVRPTTRLAST